MKAYPEYKASCIDWLGQIPSHWKISRLKYIGEARNGLTYSPEDICEEDKGVLVLRSSNIQNDSLSFENNVYVSKIVDDLMMKEGDILICSRNGSASLIGKCAIIPKDVEATFGAFMMRYRSNIDKKFTLYLIRTTLAQYRELFSTSTINQLTNAMIGNMQVALPPVAEQEAIAAYLDEVTGKVDALIAEKHKQVENLRSYRTSLITETVTRGLNPDAPLRPSGIDWLGDLPEHWETTKLKYVSTVQTGSTPSTSVEKYWDNPVKDWFTPGDFITFKLSSSNRRVSEAAFNEGACRIFPKNSTLLVGIGATLGKVGITTVECSANQQVNAITFNDKIYPLYGAYYLSSCNDALNSVSNASTLAILNQDQTKQFPMVVPPISEQKVIAEFLDKKTEKIDTLISELEKQLEELTEYKKAVISEAVTGKVDVRDWKPQN